MEFTFLKGERESLDMSNQAHQQSFQLNMMGEGNYDKGPVMGQAVKWDTEDRGVGC